MRTFYAREFETNSFFIFSLIFCPLQQEIGLISCDFLSFVASEGLSAPAGYVAGCDGVSESAFERLLPVQKSHD